MLITVEGGRKSRSNMLLSWTHLIKNTIPTPHTPPHGILEPAVLTGAELAAPPSLSETSVTRKHSYGHPHLPHPTRYSCSNFKDKFMSLSSWTEFSNKRNLESLMQNICKLLQDQNDGFGTREMIQSEGRCLPSLLAWAWFLGPTLWRKRMDLYCKCAPWLTSACVCVCAHA